MSRLRKVIAERAVASLQGTAQLTTVVEVDVTAVARLRDAKKGEFLAKTGNKLSFLPFFVFAAAEALKSYPIVNATVEDDSIVFPAHENISIAVDTERGLLTPVVRDAGEKNIAQIAADIADLAARTRDNKLTPDEALGRHLHRHKHGVAWSAVRHADRVPSAVGHPRYRRRREEARRGLGPRWRRDRHPLDRLPGALLRSPHD